MAAFATLRVLSLSVGEGEPGALAALLDEEERRRARRFAIDSSRREYVAAHGLLRHLLGEVLGVAPTALAFTAEGGKPRLARPEVPDLDFNLTHAGGLVACAVAWGGMVGIDAEPVARTVEPALARRFFAKDEADWLAQFPEPDYSRAFLKLWTLKEAVIKALGVGLAFSLSAFSLRPDPPRLVTVGANMGAPEDWLLRQWAPGPGHCLALAFRPKGTSPPAIEARHLEAFPGPGRPVS